MVAGTPPTVTGQECAAFLRERYGERAEGGEFLGKGEWSSAYAFRLDAEPMVVRFGAYVEDFEKDRLMARHVRGRRGRPDLPVPEVFEIGPFGDGYFAVSRRAYGDFLDELPGPQMAATLPAVLATLRTLRAVTPPGPGYGAWDARGRAPFQTWGDALLSVAVDEPGARVSGWRRRLAESEVGTEPFDAGVGVLRALVGSLPGVPRRLVHSDLLNRNVLVRDGEVTAVFDWANAMYGDPVFDLAWLAYWWPWYPQWNDIDLRAALEPDLATLGPRDEVERRLLCCQIQIGLEHQKYNAFTGNRPEVERNTERTLDLVRQAKAVLGTRAPTRWS